MSTLPSHIHSKSSFSFLMPLQISITLFGFMVKASSTKMSCLYPSLAKNCSSSRVFLADLGRHLFCAISVQLQNRQSKTQPREVTMLVNFFGAMFAPAITQ